MPFRIFRLRTLAGANLATPVASNVVGQVGARRLIFAGGLALAAGAALLSRVAPGGSYLGDVTVLPGLLLIAAGLGLTFTIRAVAATAGVVAAEQGLASGLFNTSRQVGTTLGLALLATIASAAGTARPTPRSPSPTAFGPGSWLPRRSAS